MLIRSFYASIPLTPGRYASMVLCLYVFLPLGLNASIPRSHFFSTSIPFPLYSVSFLLYSVPCPLYSIPFPLYSVPCPLYSIPFPLYSIPFPLYSVPFPLYLDPFSSILGPFSSISRFLFLYISTVLDHQPTLLT